MPLKEILQGYNDLLTKIPVTIEPDNMSPVAAAHDFILSLGLTFVVCTTSSVNAAHFSGCTFKSKSEGW